MSLRRVVLPLVALAALFLGVVHASAHTAATRSITVEVLGKGTVKSDPSGINCGNGSNKCFAVFDANASVKLTAKPSSGWDDGTWSDDCGGTTSSPCTLTGPGDEVATADFTAKTGTTYSTLSVTYADDGIVASGDEGRIYDPPAGANIDCGNGTSAGTTCTWVVPTGSEVTVLQTPDSGNIFFGWGGECSGKAVSCTVNMNSDEQIGAEWGTPAGATTTLTVNVNGSGDVSGGGIHCPGTCVSHPALDSSVTLTASPKDGQVFTGWTGDCTGTTPTCIVTMNADSIVTATFVQANTLTVNLNGNGNVSGGSGAINCGNGASICSANFASSASITLVATPSTGATFLGWTGACGGTATTCTVLMNQAKSVDANFSGGATGGGGGATTFSLTVSVSGNGTVSGVGINCGNGATTCSSAGHASGSTITLSAVPSTGATFAGWGGGTCTGAIPTCTVTFTASKTVTATFTGGTSNVQLSVSVTGPGKVTGTGVSGISCGNGSTTCSASVAVGSTVTLTATPATGAKFAGWGGSCSGTATTCSVSMTAAKSVSATFTTAAVAGTLTINVAGKGTVSTTAGACTAVGPSKTCIQHFKAGASATLTARPSAGQSFLGWSGACAGTKVTCTVKLTTAQTVTANFSSKATGGGGTAGAALSPIGKPLVRKTSTGWNVTLRFDTTVGGVATVRGLRAGRTLVALSLRVSAGRATVGPIAVKLPGYYTFDIRLAGHLLRMRACLGTCGPRHRGDPFTFTRQAPTVTRTGDVWSVTLHATSNQIFDGKVRAFRGARLVVNQHFLGRATRIGLGPFLLGPGNYTIHLTALDPYGRIRTLTWIVSLAR